MPNTRSPIRHTMNAVKGWHDHCADILAAIDTSVVTVDIPPGRVMHLNDDFKLETGTHATAMSLFMFPDPRDPDATDSGGGDISLVDPNDEFWKSVELGVEPEVKCYVASGGFEIETTEFDDEEEYTPYICLKATVANTNAATGGLIVPGVPYQDAICGVVSRGIRPSGYGPPGGGRQALALWSVYLPQLTETIIDAIHSDLPVG